MNEDAILQLMRVPDSRPTNCNFGLLVLVSSSDPSLLDQHSAQQMAVQPAPNSSQNAFHKSQIDLASPRTFPESQKRQQEDRKLCEAALANLAYYPLYTMYATCWILFECSQYISLWSVCVYSSFHSKVD